MVATAFVSRFPLTLGSVHACPNIVLSSIKVSFIIARKTGNETIKIVSPFGGCAQYMLHTGYVADPACALPSSMTRLTTFVAGVYVSDRLTDYSFIGDSRN